MRVIVLFLLLASGVVQAQPSATVGSVRGELTDTAARTPAVGAIVIATSSTLQGEQTAIADDRGVYFLDGLPPGVYRLTVYYLDTRFTRDNVLVQLGKQAVVDIAFAPSSVRGEVIAIEGRAPLIDQGSTKIGATLTDDYTRNVPAGRRFGDVVGAVAGAQRDRYGISLAGTTSPETSYVVDGLVVTDPLFATLSAQLPNEFIAETEIITGGYNAEYGRATGGIVNVITKQGSNELHGSFFGHLTPSSFVAPAATIRREGVAIDSRTELERAYDIGAELGFPLVRDVLWLHLGFAPHVRRDRTERIVGHQVDVDQDGVPDVDPETGFNIHEPVSTLTLRTRETTYYFTSKLTGAIGERHRGSLSVFGNPSTGNGINRANLSAAPDTLMTHIDAGAYNAVANWTSKLGDAFEAAASVGWHRTREYLRAQDQRLSIGYLYERSLYDFADVEPGDIEACRDDSDADPYPRIVNCPVNGYFTQGAGSVPSRRDDRWHAALSLTHRARLAGYHVLKAGIDAEHATDDATFDISGGFILRRQANALGLAGAWRRIEFMRVVRNLTAGERADLDSLELGPGDEICRGGRALCSVADPVGFSVADSNIGTYLQDSWLITPSLTINAGVRWDHHVGFIADDFAGTAGVGGEMVSERVLPLDSVAPRIGVVHDPTREGRAKLFAHYGRFYETLPLTASSLFTNVSVAHTRFPLNVPPVDASCRADHGTPDLVETVLSCNTRQPRQLFESAAFVASGTRGQYTDEIVAGAELEVVADLKVGATFQRRTVPIVIDDLSLDSGNTLFIGNPGESYDAAAAALRDRAATLRASGDPDDRALAATHETRADWLDNIDQFDKPIRNYNALQLAAAVRPTAKSLLLASYTYSLTKGNYPGLFNPDTGQLNPNLNTIYDLPSLLANRYGALPMDRPHNLRVDGFYRFVLPRAHALTAGAAVRVQSGIAYTALGAHSQYGAGESYLLPAGMLGRTPPTAQLDVHLGFSRKLAKDSALEAFVDVFNIFDAQTETAVDQRYTLDAANPVVGGAVDDLAHVKVIDIETRGETNRVVRPNPNFKNTTARQRPRSVQLGIRWLF